jgi:hypothetical protein
MNLTRIDLSDNLIHFVSPADKSTEDYNLSEMHPKEYAMNGDIVEEDALSPFFILRRIIRNCQLLSTWSYRKGQRTIYGKYPAICFTEMPISEFVKTSIDRQSKGQKISNYGLIFNKKELFKIGARPVIYGTSTTSSVKDRGNEKILSPDIFDDKELYRYVALKLDRLPYPIDWTHEREWRLPNYNYHFQPIDLVLWGDEEMSEEIKELYRLREEERINFHGLNIDEVSLSNIGIILRTKEQAKLVIRDILWLVDSKKIKKDTFGYVLFFDNLQANIDKLIDKDFLQNEIRQGLINLNKFFVVDKTLKEKIKKEIQSLCERYRSYNDFLVQHQGWLSGLSFPCLNNNQDSIARVLVELNLIKITKLGRYLIDLPILHPTSCMENNEKFVREIINPELQKILGVKLTYYSVGHLMARRHEREVEIDDVPFYTEPNDDEWNFSNREEDY